MMKRTILCLAWMAAGCATEPAGGSADFPEAAYATVLSDRGALSIEVRTAPVQPPQRGSTAVEYAITDAAGAPVDDLRLSVMPWMPDMGHSASAQPVVEERGEGHYVVSGVELFMPGRWELMTTITGSVDDSATVQLTIP